VIRFGQGDFALVEDAAPAPAEQIDGRAADSRAETGDDADQRRVEDGAHGELDYKRRHRHDYGGAADGADDKQADIALTGLVFERLVVIDHRYGQGEGRAYRQYAQPEVPSLEKVFYLAEHTGGFGFGLQLIYFS
jgi:hypothetical protein